VRVMLRESHCCERHQTNKQHNANRFHDLSPHFTPRGFPNLVM
jgi:hypothetical protein